MSNTIKGKVISPLSIDRTLTKEYMCADAKATGDAIRNLENKMVFRYEGSISKGDTGYCTFDITEYAENKCIAIISICGNQNVTSLAVVVWGRNYQNDLCHLVLNKSDDIEITREGNILTATKTSGGIWGSDISIIRVS
jgi:hypothetical protein